MARVSFGDVAACVVIVVGSEDAAVRSESMVLGIAFAEALGVGGAVNAAMMPCANVALLFGVGGSENISTKPAVPVGDVTWDVATDCAADGAIGTVPSIGLENADADNETAS